MLQESIVTDHGIQTRWRKSEVRWEPTNWEKMEWLRGQRAELLGSENWKVSSIGVVVRMRI